MISLGPKLIEAPEGWIRPDKPKLIDFTEVDLYPDKYRYVNGVVTIKSLRIEDIFRQHEVLRKMNTQVMVGDRIKIDIKFGHLQDGEWIDLYAKGIYRVKKLLPASHNEILLFVAKV